MVLIEVTKVIVTRNDVWALVEYRSANTSGTFGGKFGCQVGRIVPGQFYKGKITSKRDRQGRSRTHFTGRPAAPKAHALKAQFDIIGVKYARRSALFSHLKLEELLFALEHRKHSRLMAVPTIGRNTVGLLYIAFDQVREELYRGDKLQSAYPNLFAYLSAKQKHALKNWLEEWEKVMEMLKTDPWRIMYDDEYEYFGLHATTKRGEFIKATTSRSRTAMVKAVQRDLGLSDDDPRALRCKAIHAIRNHMTKTGDYWMPLQRFFEITKTSSIEPRWPCVVRDKHIALVRYAQVERFIEDKFSEIRVAFEEPSWNSPPHDARLDEHQREAVRLACTSPLFILQGGAGVGKTTVCKHIVSALHNDVSCAAPTGKAAQRLAEVTGVPAYTVHRMAYMSEQIPLSTTLLLDEQSMQEPEVLACLLNKRSFHQIIFVGDTGQLTSVGPGQFFIDLCASDIPRKELTRIYRADATSFIASNGQKIRDGDVHLDTSPESFVVIPYTTDNAMVTTCSDIYSRTQQMPMVLCNTNAEVANLNGMLRDICNPLVNGTFTDKMDLGYLGPNKYLYKDWRFGENDSVINIANKYITGVVGMEIGGSSKQVPVTKLQVANGEIGKITYIGLAPIKVRTVETAGNVTTKHKDVIRVRFDISGTVVQYSVDEEVREYLRPAYALTVNKAQGSEYDVIVVKSAATWGDKRERFYTAITRAKKKCIVFEVADANSVCIATPKATRKTFLLK